VSRASACNGGFKTRPYIPLNNLKIIGGPGPPPPGEAVKDRRIARNDLGEPRFWEKARFPPTPSWKNIIFVGADLRVRPFLSAQASRLCRKCRVGYAHLFHYNRFKQTTGSRANNSPNVQVSQEMSTVVSMLVNFHSQSIFPPDRAIYH